MPTRSLVALAAMVCCALITPAAQAAGPRHDALERALMRQVNVARAASALPRLRSAAALARAADRHTLDMVRRGFFAHTSSDGTAFAARVKRHLRAQQVGETLAYVIGPSASASRIVGMWLRSPSHRRILLSRSFRRVGVGLRHGVVAGRPAVLVTADFASGR